MKMRLLLQRSVLYLLAIIVASSLPTVAHALDTEFYQANDILFYDPSSVAPCSTTTTTPQSSTVSDEDKIAQTMIVGFETPSDTTKATVQKYKFGGVYFNGKIDPSVTSQTFDDWNAGLPSQLIVASDDEGGQIERFLSGKKSAKEMATMSDSDLTTYAKQTGNELKARGVTNVLGPVLDLDTGRQNAISPYARSFGTTSGVIATKAGDFATGLESSGIGVTFKHFPGIGKNTANTDTDYQKLDLNIGNLSEDIAPYTALVNKDPKSAVMLANEVLTGWGADPVSLNPKAVDYLQTTLKYSGVIMTDDIGVFANYATNKISLTDAVVKAYTAGVTMPLFKFTDDNAINDVISAVKTKVAPAVIDKAYQKVMAYKTALGLKTTTATSSVVAPTPGSPLPTGTTSAPATGASNLDTDVEARKQYIFQVLLGLGFTKEKAAAIWGNLYQESGQSLDPKALEHSGEGVPGYTGHGIVQWSKDRWRTDYGTYGMGDTRTVDAARTSDLTDFAPYPPKPPLDPNSLLGFAASQNKNWYDLGLQVQFIKKEISAGGGRDPASYSQVGDFMASTSTDVGELTKLWGRGYEGPSESDANWPNRISGATEALSKYGSLPAIDAGSGMASTTNSGCGETGSTGSTGGPTGSGNEYTEGLLSVPSGAYGRNVWYYNQANPKLNALSSVYTQSGHTWQECGCGPTTSITIVSSFANAPTNDPNGVLSAINTDGGVVGGCSGDVSGIQKYFKGGGYDVQNITDRKGFHALTKSDFDGIRKYLKEGYLIFAHTDGHFLGIYAADDSGKFYLFDPGARANSQPNQSFTEAQLNSGDGMSGPSAGFGLNELWAIKLNASSTPSSTSAPKAV